MARQHHARRIRQRWFAAAGGVVLVIVAWGVWGALRPSVPGASIADGTGSSRPQTIDYPQQSRDHILPGQPHPPYSSNPPTSGWHYADPAPWGYYNDELPDEQVVHNLEHGGIWISFKSADDTDVINRLVALSRRYPTKVIITLRTKNDSRIAVAAWCHLMKLEQYDEQAIVDFINRFRNRAPEFVPD